MRDFPLCLNVLHQRASLDYADQLMTSADTEDRNGSLTQRQSRKLQVETITASWHQLIFRLGMSREMIRPVIIASDEDYGVNNGQETADNSEIVTGREAQWNAPAPATAST